MQEIYKEDHPHRAKILNNVGEIYSLDGDHKIALECHFLI